ncbi:MAG: rhodanese-like domain-containing protein [Chitinophagales bacterium]|nr:rhodanese-like domain-containing protein [Chitinophagales bacterium]
MKKMNFTMLALMSICMMAAAQTFFLPTSRVDFDAYERLVQEVKTYRKDRLVHLAQFIEMSKDANTIILDARSKEMYDRKHVKGAININFSDFTQANLAKYIPTDTTRILIYCNNNFDDDPINFASKVYIPKIPKVKSEQELTLALNIPTFINLYGYGYKNVYELADLISVFNGDVEFEGTDVNDFGQKSIDIGE